MRRTLIIGWGNAFRGDDGAGLEAARRVKARSLARVSVIEHEGDGYSLAELWKDHERVILLDAMKSGEAPGTVLRIDAKASPVPKETFVTSTHAFGLAEAVALSKSTGSLPESLVVFGIEGKSFEPGTGLSPEVASSLKEVEERVLVELGGSG